MYQWYGCSLSPAIQRVPLRGPERVGTGWGVCMSSGQLVPGTLEKWEGLGHALPWENFALVPWAFGWVQLARPVLRYCPGILTTVCPGDVCAGHVPTSGVWGAGGQVALGLCPRLLVIGPF